MDKLVSSIEQKLMPFANKIGTQRHMMAIRKGIVATMPLTIVGSFFTIFLNFPIPSVAAMIEPYLAILDIPFRYTVGILALYATFGIASQLAKSYKVDSLTAGILSVMAPCQRQGQNAALPEWINALKLRSVPEGSSRRRQQCRNPRTGRSAHFYLC